MTEPRERHEKYGSGAGGACGKVLAHAAWEDTLSLILGARHLR